MACEIKLKVSQGRVLKETVQVMHAVVCPKLVVLLRFFLRLKATLARQDRGFKSD